MDLTWMSSCAFKTTKAKGNWCGSDRTGFGSWQTRVWEWAEALANYMTLGKSPNHSASFSPLCLLPHQMGTRIPFFFRVAVKTRAGVCIYLEHLNLTWPVAYNEIVFSAFTSKLACNPRHYLRRLFALTRLLVSMPCCPGILKFTVPLLSVEQPLTIKFDILKIKVLWISHARVMSLFYLSCSGI